MKQRFIPPTLILLSVLFFAVSASPWTPGQAQGNTSSLLTGTEGPAFVPGNFCVSCHLADDPRLATVTEWKGGIGREINSPCPAATTIHEELYYTERLLLMIDRAEASVGPLPEKTRSRLDGITQRYSRMLDTPVTSLDAFVSEAQTVRYQMNKAYTALNQIAQAEKQRTVLMYAAVITLIVLGSLAWGFYNTRAVRAGTVSKSWATFWRVVFFIAVLGFFTLPIFRVPPVEVLMTTEEQQQAQAILDTAQRAADAADRAQARAWMLASVGTAWKGSDPAQALIVLEESLMALEEARGNETALWGQSLAVQEVTVGQEVEMEAADLIAADLNAARGRAWALPLIAVEWNEIDPVKAAALLAAEGETLEGQHGLYRDLQLRGLALAWVKVDAAKAAPTAAQIEDPSIRAWTFRELAGLPSNQGLYDQAAKAAREIEDAALRAYALGEIGRASGQSGLYDEALAGLDSLTGAKLAYALSELAAVSGDAALVERIKSAYPDARTSALLRLGKYRAAWESTAQIDDPYEQARAQAAIASAWNNADAASRIGIPLYRDAALRDVIRKTGDASLVDSISGLYYQVQSLTALGDHLAASQLAGDLGDFYPLVELGLALAGKDPQAALALVDQMDREADKAVVLCAIAATTQDRDLLERAQGMALAARVRGNSIAPTQALLCLADASEAETVLAQAYEAAQRITTK